MGYLHQQGQSIRTKLSEKEQKLIESAQAQDRESTTGTPFNDLTCEENAYLQIAVQRTLKHFDGYKIPESLRKYADAFQLSYDPTTSNYRPTPTAEEHPCLTPRQQPDSFKVFPRPYHCLVDELFANTEVDMVRRMFSTPHVSAPFTQPFLTRDKNWQDRIKFFVKKKENDKTILVEKKDKDNYIKLVDHGVEDKTKRDKLKALDDEVERECYEIRALEYMAMMCENAKVSEQLETKIAKQAKNSGVLQNMTTLLKVIKDPLSPSLKSTEIKLYNDLVPSRYVLPGEASESPTARKLSAEFSEEFSLLFNELLENTPFRDWDGFCAQLPTDSPFRDKNTAVVACACIAVNNNQKNREAAAKTYIQYALMDPKTQQAGTSVENRKGDVKSLIHTLSNGHTELISQRKRVEKQHVLEDRIITEKDETGSVAVIIDDFDPNFQIELDEIDKRGERIRKILGKINEKLHEPDDKELAGAAVNKAEEEYKQDTKRRDDLKKIRKESIDAQVAAARKPGQKQKTGGTLKLT